MDGSLPSHYDANDDTADVTQGGSVLASWSPSYLDTPVFGEIDRYSVQRCEKR